MAKKKGLTVDEHVALGRELKVLAKRVSAISVLVRNSYPLSSRAARRADSASSAMDHLGIELEEQMFQDYPSIPDGGLRVYSGEDYADPIFSRNTEAPDVKAFRKIIEAERAAAEEKGVF